MAISAVIALIALVFWWQMSPRKQPAEPLQATLLRSAPLQSAQESVQPALPADAGDRPGLRRPSAEQLIEQTSLRGTSADGEISLDAGGRLRPDLGLKRYFDYWLGLIGERTLAQIIELAQADLATRVPPAAASAVLKALTRYLDYLEQESRRGLSADLDQRQIELKALRREVLGAELAQAFFGEEERDTDLLLARRAILRDTPPSAQPAALAALERTREQGAASARLQSVLQADVETQTQALERTDADAATRLAARTVLVGEAAAERLADLDQARAEWDNRVSAFRQARSAIERDAALTKQARQAAIEALKRRDFSDPEQRRLSALDAIDAGE